MIRFIFDLDGTVTSEEIVPKIAKKFHVENAVRALTDDTVSGNIPFVESFIRRVHTLSHLPVDEIAAFLENTRLYSGVVNFIHLHTEQCIIVTGNLDCWVSGLCQKTGCQIFASIAEVENNRVVKLSKILRKEKIVTNFQAQGDTVVFIGEGNNDLEAMRAADISIASALTHKPANAVLGITDYVVYKEEALCRQLNQLLSVVPA